MSYNGITIILNRLSRFDFNNKAINENSKSGEYFWKQFAKLGFTREQFHIETVQTWVTKGKQLPTDTRCILALGEEAHQSCNVENEFTTLNENRGAPYYYQGIPVVSSFAPIDSFDMRDYESAFHAGGSDDENEDDNDKNFGKTHGMTSRKNYRFWLTRDIYKCKRIATTGLNIPTMNEPVIFPSEDDLVDILTKYKNHYLHIDIETDPITLDITCFAFTYECPTSNVLVTPVFVVPLRRWNYVCSYRNPYRIFVALAKAFKNNCVVTWNGHQFDLFVFAYKYRIPWSETNWDGMIAQHRLLPEIEKSLGHAMSLATDLPYHKNEGIYRPFNNELEKQLWYYCAKDVFGMYHVRQWQLAYARSISGALQSIEFANSLIPAYLTITFTGMRRHESEVQELLAKTERRVVQLQKILDCLVGRPLNPRSNKQMPQYLFNKKTEGGLGLEPYMYGKVSKKTGKANPKADEKTLLKLQVKHGLASIAVILELRKLLKLISSISKVKYWNPYGECAVSDPKLQNTLTDDEADELENENAEDVEVVEEKINEPKAT